MALNYGFLKEAAGFPIKESFIPYDSTMSFGRAVLVGLINTLVVSVAGILFATVLGFIIGLMRLSSNWLISHIGLAFIEFHRNIPLLVLLFLWYFGVFTQLPPVKESILLPRLLYINQRGFYLTWPHLGDGGTLFAASVVAGIILAIITWVVLRRTREVKGKETYFGRISLAILVLVPLIGWFVSGGKPLQFDVPVLQGFNFQGGLRLTTEFTALLIGLATYTAAFIAEVFRSGIQAVQKGQIEAARAVGLRYSQILSLIIIPQAMRVDHPATDQPVLEFDQELEPGTGDRLPGAVCHRKSHHQPGWSSCAGLHLDHGDLSRHQPADLGGAEHLQQTRAIY